MKRLLLLLAVSGLAACGTRGPLTYSSSPVNFGANARGEQGPVTVNLATLLGGGAEDSLEAALKTFNDGSPTPRDRNEVVGAMLLASDRNCDLYVDNMRGSQLAWRTGFALSGQVLSTAAGIVDPTGTKDILNSLSSLTQGASSELDSQIYGGRAAELVGASIRTIRLERRSALLSRMAENYAAWPVEVAIADALQYHGLCTAGAGLAAASDIVNERLQDATDEANAPLGQQNDTSQAEG